MLYKILLRLMFSFSLWYLIGVVFINTEVQGMLGAIVAGLLPFGLVVVVLKIFQNQNDDKRSMGLGYPECIVLAFVIPLALYFSYVVLPFMRNSISGNLELLSLVPKYFAVTFGVMLAWKGLLVVFAPKLATKDEQTSAYTKQIRWWMYAVFGLFLALAMLCSVHSYNCLLLNLGVLAS